MQRIMHFACLVQANFHNTVAGRLVVSRPCSRIFWVSGCSRLLTCETDAFAEGARIPKMPCLDVPRSCTVAEARTWSCCPFSARGTSGWIAGLKIWLWHFRPMQQAHESELRSYAVDSVFGCRIGENRHQNCPQEHEKQRNISQRLFDRRQNNPSACCKKHKWKSWRSFRDSHCEPELTPAQPLALNLTRSS